MYEFDSRWFEQKLNEMNNLIFNGYEIDKLTNIEKREMIFDYLMKNIKYDYNLLNIIVNNEFNKNLIIPRDLSNEIMNVVINKKGVCNSISQVYKLLLEKVGIYAVCVVTDNSQRVLHQLNLVYNKDEDSYSFDDITSVIVGMGSKEKFFNYDLEDACKLGQGKKNVIDDKKWVAFDTETIYVIVNRTDEEYKKLGVIEILEEGLLKFPTNIRKSNITTNDINNYARR